MDRVLQEAEDRIRVLRQAQQRAPDSLEILDELSAALLAVGDYAAAEAALRRALEVDGSLGAVHLRLGSALALQGRWSEAARAFEETLARDPVLVDAHRQLGDALTKLQRVPEAVACYRRALALDPGHSASHNSLGHALQDLGLSDAALARYQRALALDPSFSIARHNLGVLRLTRHDFEQGWPLYERRLECPPVRPEVRKDAATLAGYERLPRWRGPGESGGKEVAIWAEQGIGDQILHSTLLPELEATGMAVVYEVDRRLLGAYQRAFPRVRFVPFEEPPRPPLPDASRVLLAGSLPALFRPTRASFARQKEHILAALPGRAAHWRSRMPGPGLKVALSWRSSRADGPVRRKTAPLVDFAPLLDVSGAQFVDVQYGDTGAERRAAVEGTGARLLHFEDVDIYNDLEEVLAILEACDLVITTSNATAHFAGALGKRTWLLYPQDNPPFHYWAPGEDRRSLWYPSVEIISSARLADWRSLAGETAARLQKEIASLGTVQVGAAARGVPDGDWAGRVALLRRENRLDEAVTLARDGLKREPRNARALAELAHALRWQGKLEEARDAATRASEIEPGLAVAWFNLGAARVETGDVMGGIAAYRRALAAEPEFAEAWSNLGGALAAAGDAPGEIDAYFRAVGANAALAPAWSNLGNALLEAGDLEESVEASRRAVALAPGYAAAWSNLGNALRERGDHDEAVRACERAIENDPELAQAWSNLGCALLEQGDSEGSLAAHRRALALAPDNARVHYNLGLAEERRGRLQAAEASYRRAVELAPEWGAAGIRLGCALLGAGNFAAGWPAYERRWQAPGARPRRYDFAPWAGQRTPGGRLLVWGEQGLGDELIYASMAGELVEAGLEVTLEVDPRMVTLMQRSFPAVKVIARTEPASVDASAFDWQCPSGSLGRWLRPAFGAFPRHRGYLVPDAARVERYAARLRGAGRSRTVGISWHSANREFGARKTMALADWGEILRVPGTRFVDLQYGDTWEARETARSAGAEITHLDDLDLYHDLEGLAALCAACDLVITASNVTAHMAGALGRPVWLLAPAGSGRIWYWFHGREDSPWYPSMRVYSQSRPGSWREPLAAVARDLAAFVEGAG
jgi:tetratricopeptide (TPR) repeat protein/ADP-heptose:LPS heptosyltransferase